MTRPVSAPDAEASDPLRMGWMQGCPVAPDRQVLFQDGSLYRFPQWRWSFSHWRELVPTVEVARGEGPVSMLPRAERDDLDALEFTPLGATRSMSWRDSLAANFTDGILVLHRGRIFLERYFGALEPQRCHIAFSVTKSFFGTLAAMLAADGALDPAARVARYLPELARSGFGEATVDQVLDMTTALDYTEDYADPSSQFESYARAAGMLPREPGPGPGSICEFLCAIAPRGRHGTAFTYRSPNTDVLGWLIARIAGQSIADLLGSQIWSKLGAEGDACIAVDAHGMPWAAAGLNLRLRDLARFGEMMRLEGRFNGRQIVPAAVVREIRRGGSREAFVHAAYPTLPGWSYHRQWWISHDDHGAYMGRGIHGQAVYVDPRAEVVIARFASHPVAGNVALDPTSLPAYRAVAEHLMRNS